MPLFPRQELPGTAPPAATPVAPGHAPSVIGAPDAEARPQRKRRWAAIIAVHALAGAGGLGGGGYGLLHEFTRGPTHAELTRASNAEQAQRWQELPAGRIFPAVIPYETDALPYTTLAGTTEQAHLVGVLPASGCPSALDPVAAGALRANGCHTMLRAIYGDLSGTVLVTIGLAVMPTTRRPRPRPARCRSGTACFPQAWEARSRAVSAATNTSRTCPCSASGSPQALNT